jgi:hypothetical protein
MQAKNAETDAAAVKVGSYGALLFSAKRALTGDGRL